MDPPFDDEKLLDVDHLLEKELNIPQPTIIKVGSLESVSLSIPRHVLTSIQNTNEIMFIQRFLFEMISSNVS